MARKVKTLRIDKKLEKKAVKEAKRLGGGFNNFIIRLIMDYFKK